MADQRNISTKPVAVYDFVQLSWASGETDAQVAVLKNGNPNAINGIITRFKTVISNSTNVITFTVAATESNSGAIFSIASIPKNATTIKNALAATPDFEQMTVVDTVVFTITPSGDPGASGVTLDLSAHVK